MRWPTLDVGRAAGDGDVGDPDAFALFGLDLLSQKRPGNLLRV